MPELELPIWVAGIGLGYLVRHISPHQAFLCLLAGGAGIGAFGAAVHLELLNDMSLPFDVLQSTIAAFIGYYGSPVLFRAARTAKAKRVRIRDF
jgi:hypothetical protein